MKVQFKKTDCSFADNEYAIKIGGYFVADIYPPQGRKKRAAVFDRSIEHRFSSKELRTIADKLDELNQETT